MKHTVVSPTWHLLFILIYTTNFSYASRSDKLFLNGNSEYLSPVSRNCRTTQSPVPLSPGAMLSFTLSSGGGKYSDNVTSSMNRKFFTVSIDDRLVNGVASPLIPGAVQPEDVIVASLKSFLSAHKAPQHAFLNLEEVVKYFENRSTFSFNLTGNLSAQEIILKAMIYSLQLNDQDQTFVPLLEEFKRRNSGVSNPEMLIDLLKLIISILFDASVNLETTFSRIIVAFFEFLVDFPLIGTYENSLRFILETAFNAKFATSFQINPDSNFVLFLNPKVNYLLDKVENYIFPAEGPFIHVAPVSEILPMSFFSLFTNSYYRNFQRDRVCRIVNKFKNNYTGPLMTKNCIDVLETAAIFSDSSNFAIIFSKLTTPDISSILSNLPIMSNDAITSIFEPLVPKITEIDLDPRYLINFTDSSSASKNLIRISLIKATPEEMFSYFFVRKLYKLLDFFLKSSGSVVVLDHEAIANYLKQASFELELNEIVVECYKNHRAFLKFLYYYLRHTSTELEINQTILFCLDNLSSDYYTSQVIGVFKDLSTGLDDLFMLALKQRNFTSLEILAAFFGIENSGELLTDEIAAKRAIAFSPPIMHLITENAAIINILML